jgi:hypothetical protein
MNLPPFTQTLRALKRRTAHALPDPIVTPLLEHLAHSKVAQLGSLSVGAEEDVFGLEVEVDNIVLVKVFEAHEDLGEVSFGGEERHRRTDGGGEG